MNTSKKDDNTNRPDTKGLSRHKKILLWRSRVRLTPYLIALLILAPISITLELLRDFCDSANDRLNDLGQLLQKWAYSGKP